MRLTLLLYSSLAILTTSSSLSLAQATPPLSACGAFAIGRVRTDSTRLPYTSADIQFMALMISHHAQAIVMARMAPTHSASQAVQTLAARMIKSENDDITFMQSWLRDRNQPVPEAKPVPVTLEMNGQVVTVPVPGTRSEAEMMQLDSARGTDFDRLFLRRMIQHHLGATSMVEKLLAKPGFVQHEAIFRFVVWLEVDQNTESDCMEQLFVDEKLGVVSTNSKQ